MSNHLLKVGTKCYCGETDVPAQVLEVRQEKQNVVMVVVRITETSSGYTRGEVVQFRTRYVTPRTARSVDEFGRYKYASYRFELTTTGDKQ